MKINDKQRAFLIWVDKTTLFSDRKTEIIKLALEDNFYYNENGRFQPELNEIRKNHIDRYIKHLKENEQINT